MGDNLDSGAGEQSLGHRIYWKGKQTVTVEWLVIFATEENRGLHLEIEANASEVEREGEGKCIEFTTSNSGLKKPHSDAIIPNNSVPLTIPQTSDQTKWSTRNRFPSLKILDLLEGSGHTGYKNQLIPTGITNPTNSALEGHLLEAAMAEAKEDEPKSLAKTKRSKDWPNWEAVIQE